jgi:hypothetical protein
MWKWALVGLPLLLHGQNSIDLIALVHPGR